MMDDKYMVHLKYVKDYLIRNHGMASPNALHPFRSRFQHSIRVLHWCFRLAEGMEGIDHEALYLAAIFHDVGYQGTDNGHHAIRSGKIFHEYAVAQNMDPLLRDKVERLIYAHSNKKLLKAPDIDKELILLLEADLMDEEGAMGVVWDCMAMGNVHANSYAKAYYHIMENSNKEEPNPMVTEKAKAYWDEKKRIVARFAELLADDLMIGSPYFDI